MSRATVGLVVLILAGAVAGALAHLPAARALAWFAPERVEAAGVSGSIWSGRAERLAFGGPEAATDVSWDLTAWRLLTGRLAGNARLDFSEAAITGTFTVTPAGRVTLQATEIDGPANALVALAQLPALAVDGDLLARIDSATLAGQRLRQVNGQFQWDAARIVAPLQLELGSVRGRITPNEQGGHALELGNQGGQVALDGNIELAADRSYQLTVELRPRQDTPAKVTETLNQFLPRRGDRFVIQRDGQL